MDEDVQSRRDNPKGNMKKKKKENTNQANEKKNLVTLIFPSICMPPQQFFDIRVIKATVHESICNCHTY
jgi:hypothetical protein